MGAIALVTLPSSGTRSPGLMRTVAPMATEATGAATHAPLGPAPKPLRAPVQASLDSVSGPVHRLGFDEFGNRVQGHHHRGFRPLPNEECAGDGHRHQRIDVQLAAQQRRNAFL